ncbi:hypothetical protein BC830DRAFT_1089503 [Chytriomyces sp. MP71]|nr:hypothetical protein BC830DRAFT_1089503 [Chytriomyces sp. MP71]
MADHRMWLYTYNVGSCECKGWRSRTEVGSTLSTVSDMGLGMILLDERLANALYAVRLINVSDVESCVAECQQVAHCLTTVYDQDSRVCSLVTLKGEEGIVTGWIVGIPTDEIRRDFNLEKRSLVFSAPPTTSYTTLAGIKNGAATASTLAPGFRTTIKPTQQTQSAQESNTNSTLSLLVIIGASVGGGVIGLFIIGSSIWCCSRCRKSAREKHYRPVDAFQRRPPRLGPGLTPITPVAPSGSTAGANPYGTFAGAPEKNLGALRAHPGSPESISLAAYPPPASPFPASGYAYNATSRHASTLPSTANAFSPPAGPHGVHSIVQYENAGSAEPAAQGLITRNGPNANINTNKVNSPTLLKNGFDQPFLSAHVSGSPSAPQGHVSSAPANAGNANRLSMGPHALPMVSPGSSVQVKDSFKAPGEQETANGPSASRNSSHRISSGSSSSFLNRMSTGVEAAYTSAGNPSDWTPLQAAGWVMTNGGDDRAAAIIIEQGMDGLALMNTNPDLLLSMLSISRFDSIAKFKGGLEGLKLEQFQDVRRQALRAQRETGRGSSRVSSPSLPTSPEGRKYDEVVREEISAQSWTADLPRYK